MLTGIHYILTYTCNFECDHCFLYCSPRAHGTFSAGQVDQVLDAASTIGTVEWIFFEGGEPFLYYPLLRHGIQQAAARGFNVGLVTNAYGANSEKDAGLWLKPLADAGLSHLSISNDTYHYGEETENPATIAAKVAKRIGIETASICIEPPTVVQPSAGNEKKAAPWLAEDQNSGAGRWKNCRSTSPSGHGAIFADAPLRISNRPPGCMWIPSAMSTSARESAWAICGRRHCLTSFPVTGPTVTPFAAL
jgi:hypothetical protein